MTCHRCNLDVWALEQSLEVGHRSLVTPESVFSEYKEGLIFFLDLAIHPPTHPRLIHQMKGEETKFLKIDIIVTSFTSKSL